MPGPKPGAEERRVYGIYATPRPVAGYLLRSVDVLLRCKLGKAAGLADPGVRFLDPAAGPANFLLAAWRQALAAHRQSGGEAGDLIRDHLLPHFLGVEIRRSAHARGLRALRRFLAAAGYGRAPAEPLPALLADSLAPPPELLAATANVVVGNPPWRGCSWNRGPWITGLLRGYRLPDGREDEGYFRVDGQSLAERNSKWLNDDYVKFLRLAQWQVDWSGEGVVGFVLNHNLLDAPTFRGLRRSLLRTFQEVYALDLHGNARKRERGPGGERDENVFRDVAQGAAILLLVKKPGLPPRALRADLHGSRREKLRFLDRSDVQSTPWQEVAPGPPGYLFLAGDRAVEREYQRGLPLPEIFPVHGVGIITGRDAVVTAVDRRTLERRVADLRERSPEGAPPGLSAHHVEELKRDVRWRGKLTGFLARPFDLRFVLYASYLLARPRAEVMAHMAGGANLGLIVPRRSREEPGALVSRWISGHKAVSAYDVSTLFPLYLASGPARRPNVAPHLAFRLAERYGAAPEPEALLGYVYAVLYSAAYRRRYRELLARGFPRVAFPEDPRLFATVAGLGRELIGVHLFEDPRLRHTGVRLIDDGDRRVASDRKCRYGESDRSLFLNERGLALVGLEPGAWSYRIGGYCVLGQWLKARAGRLLGTEERKRLPAIAEALHLTLELQSRVAEVTWA